MTYRSYEHNNNIIIIFIFVQCTYTIWKTTYRTFQNFSYEINNKKNDD